MKNMSEAIRKLDDQLNEKAINLAKKYNVIPTLDFKILIQRILEKMD